MKTSPPVPVLMRLPGKCRRHFEYPVSGQGVCGGGEGARVLGSCPSLSSQEGLPGGSSISAEPGRKSRALAKGGGPGVRGARS